MIFVNAACTLDKYTFLKWIVFFTKSDTSCVCRLSSQDDAHIKFKWIDHRTSILDQCCIFRYSIDTSMLIAPLNMLHGYPSPASPLYKTAHSSSMQIQCARVNQHLQSLIKSADKLWNSFPSSVIYPSHDLNSFKRRPRVSRDVFTWY